MSVWIQTVHLLKKKLSQVSNCYKLKFLGLSLQRFLPKRADTVCPGLNAEIKIPRVKHHKVSSLVKSHQNTHNSVKYEVI